MEVEVLVIVLSKGLQFRYKKGCLTVNQEGGLGLWFVKGHLVYAHQFHFSFSVDMLQDLGSNRHVFETDDIRLILFLETEVGLGRGFDEIG